jgi:hypothetical protein
MFLFKNLLKYLVFVICIDDESLRKLGQIGHVRKIKSKLDELEAEFPDCSTFFMSLREFITDFNLTSYMAELEHNHE